MSILALMQDIEDDDESLEEALDGLIDPSDQRRGVVPADWRFKRQIGSTLLNPALRFAAIVAPESVSHLRVALASAAVRLGLEDFDLSAVFSTARELTQQCARYVYELDDERSQPQFAGLCYPSRHNLNWTCWAIFDDRLLHAPQLYETTIDPHDPGLLEAARLMNLGIEGVRGQIFVP